MSILMDDHNRSSRHGHPAWIPGSRNMEKRNEYNTSYIGSGFTTDVAWFKLSIDMMNRRGYYFLRGTHRDPVFQGRYFGYP